MTKFTLTFAVFIVGLMVMTRLGPNIYTAMAKRFAVSQNVRFNSDGIRQHNDRSTTQWPWESLSRLHSLDRLLVLEFSDWSWIPVPDRLWSDPAGKQRFFDNLRTIRPDLSPCAVTSSVATPFTLINVGAGFAAAELFLLQVFGATSALLSPSHWPAALQYAGQSVPRSLGALFAAAFCVAVFGFFVTRYALRRLERRYPRVAACLSAGLIAIFAVLVIASLVYHPCGC